LRGKFVTRGDY